MKLVLACLSFTALLPSFVWETGHKTTPTVLPEMPLLVPLWRLHLCILWCFRLYIFLIFIFMHHFFSCLRSAILMSRSAILSCSAISTLESGSVLYLMPVLPPLMNLEGGTTLKLKGRSNHTIKVNFICDSLNC